MSGWRILGDWGSSRLRLWRVRDGAVEDRLTGPGIVNLACAPSAALREAIAPWLGPEAPERITLSGMAGARGGLHEAPYAGCPLTVAAWKEAGVRLNLDGIAVRIAAGCADGCEDVMRGEETQLFGALRLRPELGRASQVVVLPGTHCKWVWLEEGAIRSFRTFPTGELFALLQSSSLLSAGGDAASADDGAGFAEGIAQAQRSPGVLGKLFTARAAQLRRGRSQTWAKAYLSGLLIAGEVAEMRAAGPLPQRVVVIGDAALASRYETVLAASGIAGEVLDGETCALAGLRLLDHDD